MIRTPAPIPQALSIVVTEKGGAQRRFGFGKSELTIGRVQGNDIILPRGNVSKRHARIVQKDGRFIVVDLKSTNGTYVNGRKITSPLVVRDTDKIYIGDFILTIDAPDTPPPLPPDSVLPVPPPPIPPPPIVAPAADEPAPAEAEDLERSAERVTSDAGAETTPPPPPVSKRGARDRLATLELWERLVVAAVQAGKDAQEAIAIADVITKRRGSG